PSGDARSSPALEGHAVAAGTRQPELRRRLPSGVSVALIAAVVSLALAAGADAVPSGYMPERGGQFFLLSDASFGSDAPAAVRLESSVTGPLDVVVYRVPQPLDFLKAQKNLHRIDVRGRYQFEGLANTLRHLWGAWNRQARYAWQRVFGV